VTTILFCGISRDPEFYEPRIFVKHRPTLKIHFYTPIGESDLTLSDLTEDKKKEELLYQEFVEDQGIYSHNLNRLLFLPPILIQLTLTFLCFGTIRQNETKPRSLIIHFLINIIPSAMVIVLMLFDEKTWQLLGLSTLLLIINFWTIRLTLKKSSAEQKL
jgi:hypothetical protein